MTTTTKTGAQTDDSIGQRLHDAGDRLVETKDGDARTVGPRVDPIGALTRAHLFAAMGVGLGIGYLIGRAIHR
jgi:hypothetical protein